MNEKLELTKEQIGKAIQMLSLRDKLHTCFFGEGEGENIDLDTLLGAIGMFLGLNVCQEDDSQEQTEAIAEAIVKMVKEGFHTQAAEERV
ncbi:MAG: hypothetical protein ACI9S8_003126 [Chlamydiales bacterium]|jgi:hypothetical protein